MVIRLAVKDLTLKMGLEDTEDKMSIFWKLVTATTITALLMVGVGFASQPAQANPTTGLNSYTGIPTFSIVSVVRDQSVTVQTYNLPPNDKFDVTMGPMGTQGIGGIKVASVDSGSGGAKVYTFSIPSSLAGSYKISIRMQSPFSGYYAYNWFYNNTTGSATQPPPTTTPPPSTTPPPGYSGFPTFSITSVERDKSVTIQTNNLPPNDTFRVTMGPMGTQGIGGIVVDVVDSGSGGSKTYTFDTPQSLYGSYKISIRMQSPTSGYFAYNWFYNNTTGGSGGQPPAPSPTPPPGYTGFPTFNILAVVRDTSVKVQTYNLPPNDSFDVTMGPMGTQGIGGIKVDTINTGSGGAKQYTFNIPGSLKGSYKISIRMQSPTSGYFAYNWFYNNNAGTP
jgi:hypothetical protein